MQLKRADSTAKKYYFNRIKIIEDLYMHVKSIQFKK